MNKVFGVRQVRHGKQSVYGDLLIISSTRRAPMTPIPERRKKRKKKNSEEKLNSHRGLFRRHLYLFPFAMLGSSSGSA